MDVNIFDDNGNMTIFLKLQIVQYSKENNISVLEIIKLLKEAASLKQWCLWSLSGYESFKWKMEILKQNKNVPESPI